MKIFNRWGELLNNINEKWDGTRKGRKCKRGVYFYVANYTYIHEQKGLVEKQQTGSVTLYK